MAIVYVGADLARNMSALHGVDDAGKPALARGRSYTASWSASSTTRLRMVMLVGRV